jgi:TMEM175 potassium channel family protein
VKYLGYFVSFAFIGGVWIAHSNMTRFLKAADPDLMRLNLILLLFVSFLPFTTAIAATHLFASNLTFHEVTVASSAERVAVVVFGLDLTLAALMLYLMPRHAGRTPDVAAADLAEEELQAFAQPRCPRYQATAPKAQLPGPFRLLVTNSWSHIHFPSADSG